MHPCGRADSGLGSERLSANNFVTVSSHKQGALRDPDVGEGLMGPTPLCEAVLKEGGSEIYFLRFGKKHK